MRKFVVFLVIVLAGFGIWWFFFKGKNAADEPKQEALRVGKHSALFNESVNSAMSAYFDIKSALVEADTAQAKAAGAKFIVLFDSIRMDELKKDTSGIYQTAEVQIGDVKANAVAMTQDTGLTEIRQDFRMISENLYPLLKTIGYEGKKLYWQNCPMAFGEGKEANWISNTQEIVNPYLGKKDPEFKSAMLHCGEIKDTID